VQSVQSQPTSLRNMLLANLIARLTLVVSYLSSSSTLKIEPIYSSETFYFQRVTQHYIPDGRTLLNIVSISLISHFTVQAGRGENIRPK
jgi:hypothetical protein